jgi:hypothetical protein
MIIAAVIVLVLFAVVVLALLLPVVVHFHIAGGTDNGFLGEGRILLFNGFAGIGFCAGDSGQRFIICLFGKDIFSVAISSFASNAGDRVKKFAFRKTKEREVAVEKLSIVERIRGGIRRIKEFWGYFKEAGRIFNEVVRIDFFRADLTLGFGDPALTGWITGIIFALNGFLPPQYSIKPSFDFTREVMRGDASGKITLISIRVWKNLFANLPRIFRFVRSRKRMEAELVTQEV